MNIMEFMMNSIWVFLVLQLINVILNTIKSIITVKGTTLASAIVNTITYGVYTIIVVFTASDSFTLLEKVIITMITNFIGVYISALILKKIRKDKLWEIVATIDNEYGKECIEQLALGKISFNYNLTDNYKHTKFVFRIYTENQKQSAYVKELLDNVKAKYIVHEEQVRL